MSLFTIAEILSATGGRLIKGCANSNVKGVSIDTRTINPGEVFIALPGERFDGHNFLTNAVQKQAAALIIRQGYIPDDEVMKADNIISVEDSLKALQNLANYHLNKFKPIVIGITGSTGKTTTKELVASVLSQKYGVLKTLGNYNNEIGLPLSLFSLNKNQQIAVLEMGMSGLGEIERLTEIAPPQLAIVTNIGVTHLEKLGSIEGIVQAKGELLKALSAEGSAILNADDPQTSRLIPKVKGKVFLVGEKSKKAELRVLGLRSSGEYGVGFTVGFKDKTYDLFVPIPGKHNVTNALFAVAAGLTLGLSFEEIAKGLAGAKTEKMRLNIVENSKGVKFINDAYNANPVSMIAALDVLCELKGIKKFAILGDMLELGPLAEQAHRQIGQAVVEKKIDYLFTLGELAGLMAEEALRAGASPESVYTFAIRDKLVDELKKHLSAGDLVLVKGSRGMGMEEIIKQLEN